MIKIYTDGSCIGNPGRGGWAAIILDEGKKTEIKGSKKDIIDKQISMNYPVRQIFRPFRFNIFKIIF